MSPSMLQCAATGLRILALAWICVASSASAAKPSEKATGTVMLSPDEGRLIVDVHGVPPPAPLFFSASVDETVRLSVDEITSEARLRLRTVQGKPEVFRLGLTGDAEVVSVSGGGLRDWSVGSVPAADLPRRFLELRPNLGERSNASADWEFTVRTRRQRVPLPGTITLTNFAPGEAVGFAAKVSVQADSTLEFRVAAATGYLAVAQALPTLDRMDFVATGEGRLQLELGRRGASAGDAELVAPQVTGRLAGEAVEFRLRAQLRARKAGARVRLLLGRAAIDQKTAGDGWHVEAAREGTAYAYELVADREGSLPVELPFLAGIRDRSDWRSLEFVFPAGAVVPLFLEGLGREVSFKTDAPVVPVLNGEVWQGFLPADGAVSLAWKPAREASEGALFFTTQELADVRVGGGLVRGTSEWDIQVLQGRLSDMRFRLEGSGEVMAVEGANLVGWQVEAEGSSRVLIVRFSRPIEGQARLVVRSQTDLATYPARAEPLRLSPERVVRHSGFLRLSNHGAVRLEVADASGLMQLAPNQYPGPVLEAGVRQVFAYRFPSAAYAYRILADQIQSEVSVSALTLFELTETDRVIQADIELDVREAPLSEWSLRIPHDFVVVALTGSDVADYAVESTVQSGYRTLKVVFNEPVEGRALVQMRLEKNQPASAGEWVLTPLLFPQAKSVRGHVGAISGPGYRLVSAEMKGLVEVPLAYFPKQSHGLQQAWRVREADGSARLRVEATGQSIQADVFHLYSIKEGVVYGSVVLNYFVVGAPASEWRIEVPSRLGNVDVVGQNVRRDWRREGEQLVVSLHQPVLGAATLLITFEQPMSARGGAIHPGEVRPIGVQSERGYLEVVSPLQVKHSLQTVEGGLLKLEPMELPTEYKLMTTSPVLALYQYTARPLGLEIGIEWYAGADTADQVIDFAKLSSRVSREGQVVTDAQYFVKTRGRKALRLTLPEGMKLWETRVEGELTPARVDGEQILVPLPPRPNANDPVSVALRLGQSAVGSGRHIRLRAPVGNVPMVVSQWTLQADSGRLLVPTGGNAKVVRPALTETGYEWVSQQGRIPLAGWLCLLGLGIFISRARSTTGKFASAVIGLTATVVAVMLMADATVDSRSNQSEITYAASMVGSGESLTLEVTNTSPWQALWVGWGLVLLAAGLILMQASLLAATRRRRGAVHAAPGRLGWPVLLHPLVLALEVMLVAAGILAQRAGAVAFFALCAAGAFLLLVVAPFTRRRGRDSETEPPSGLTGPGLESATPLLLLAFGALGFLGAAPETRAETRLLPPAVNETKRPLHSLVQNWTIRGERLSASAEVTVRGAVGEIFLLLQAPAVLTDFKGEGLRVGKATHQGRPAYVVALEKDGSATARLSFELPLPDRATPLRIPTGPTAAHRLTITLDQPGWEFVSPSAVQVLPTSKLPDGQSGATLVLAPADAATVQFRPKQRDLSKETPQFFAEVANLYVPGPGAVNGYARVTVRPVQGRVAEATLDIPDGYTVGDVARGPVGAWRFDPEKRRLQVSLEPAQAETFQFDVEIQRGAGSLPFDLSVAPLHVLGAAGEIGTVALAFGGDAQPETPRARDLSPVSPQDFVSDLVPRTREATPVGTVQHVWRYARPGGRVEVRIAPVAPEVRVAARHVLSLDDDRLVMAVDLNVSILRVGIFKLSFALPPGLELEAASGAALNQWTEAAEGTQRIVTLHLNGRTLGDQTFALSLSGAAPGPQSAWLVPKIVLREATRQTGETLLVPGKGLRLQAVEREKVTPVDPRSIGGLQPGTLAFRVLQADGILRVAIEALDAWTTVQALQESTLREGQVLTQLAVRYRFENAAVKSVRLRLIGLDEERARTVRATGTAVSEIVRVSDLPDTWEVRFQRGLVGETDVRIEYQGAADGGQVAFTPPEFPGARQVAQFVAVRSGGRLDIDTADTPRGWTRVDWSAVPAVLQNRNDRSVPTLSFRVAEPERALAVAVKRHDVADALKLRATQGNLMTLFAPGGLSMNAVDLEMEVMEKSTLRVRLPKGARLYSAQVNGEAVSVVREEDAYLFHVSPADAGDLSAGVRFVYSAPGKKAGDVSLEGPSLNVPLENVTWRVALPPGYELESYRGGLRIRGGGGLSLLGVEDYRSLVASKRSAEAKKAVEWIQEANTLLQQGDQERASQMLNRASNMQALDEATNEDARVQLKNLKTQQTVLGLATRRQRLYLDNRMDAAKNEQLEQAASLNPFIQGKGNFDPQQMDQLMMGNTAEENTALRGIASRLVEQQLTAEPAPTAIDVTLPDGGSMATFTRSLQVDGSAPLELRLEIDEASPVKTSYSVLVLLALGAVTLVPLTRKN